MVVNENKNCKCESKECVRHGNCIECQKHHKDLENTLPYCRREFTNSAVD